jgi:hypothetical protein
MKVAAGDPVRWPRLKAQPIAVCAFPNDEVNVARWLCVIDVETRMKLGGRAIEFADLPNRRYFARSRCD